MKPDGVETPIRAQYLRIKRDHPDAIVFFRLGDFYETFDEDAHIVARELDVVLTSRNMAKGKRVPMAGVPHHASETYIARLIARGYKVAICEQTTREPVKGLMAREVVRIVTPGTVTEPVLLNDKRNNFLAAVAFGEDQVGIAYADITTGEFATTQLARDRDNRVLRELLRLGPAELVLSDGGDAFLGHGEALTSEAHRRYPELAQLEVPTVLYSDWRFDTGVCRETLLSHFGVTTLTAFGCEALPHAVRAAGVVVQYLREQQPAALRQLRNLFTYSIDDYMVLDAGTRRNLEILETLRDGTVSGSLLGVLDQTLTPMGGRLMRRWLSQPLLERAAIEQRSAAVAWLFGDLSRRSALRSQLRGLGDLERLANRVIQGIAAPRDLIGLRAALECAKAIQVLLSTEEISGALGQTPDLLRHATVDDCPEVVALIDRAIVDDPPATTGRGGIIRAGYAPELDEIAASAADARRWVAGLERAERDRTGIKSLKVGFNRVFGYYIEVTQSNAAAVPPDYIRKQTLVNAERYITPELKERETLILNAADRIAELEASLFRDLLAQITASGQRILATARALALLDVCASLADVAAARGYVRPELGNDRRIDIIAGRHPVVELTLQGEPFVPNDTHLSADETLHIITGPNMSGKSTYMRQVALIVLMAQVGSFVPAREAYIGLVDRIFARVGAQDEISAGQSTFMVEMIELAQILNHATNRSLVILDEIGRGTSTYDGVSIAWAAVEYLHNHPALLPRTLFATHFHELTDLDRFLAHVRNYNVAVRHEGEHVVFTHDIVPGGADRSYGIHVARMAGLPLALIERAREILRDLEKAAQRVPVSSGRQAIKVRQLPLFQETHPVVEELRHLDVMALSPLEALNTLAALKKKAQ